MDTDSERLGGARSRGVHHRYTLNLPTQVPGALSTPSHPRQDMLPSLLSLQAQLDRGETSALALTQAALSRIQASDGEGARTFTRVYTEQALAAARASDLLRAAGLSRSPIDGLPISVKDLFDVAGDTTLAGSVVLKDSPAASKNAVVVQRLIDAGAVIVGKTNMTEFAFSGLGLNPHYG